MISLSLVLPIEPPSKIVPIRLPSESWISANVKSISSKFSGKSVM